MILKIKKTSEIVDVVISRNKDHVLTGVYWDKNTNNGSGGWKELKINNFVPIDYKTDNEKHSEELNKIINAKIDEYKRLFHLKDEH